MYKVKMTDIKMSRALTKIQDGIGKFINDGIQPIQ